MTSLKEVRVTDTDSCITYALRRIGFSYDSNDVVDYDFLLEQANQGLFTKEEVDDSREVGDILVLEYKPTLISMPNVITRGGFIQTNTVPTSRVYCMVFETPDVISGIFNECLVDKTHGVYYKKHPGITIMGYDGFSKKFITGLCGTQPPYILRRVR